jgi:hypothetical protein
MNWTRCLGLLVVAASMARAESPLVQPQDVRKVFGDGKTHNAFTALAKFKGDYWLAFRSGKDHNSPDAAVVVLRSTDGTDWKEAFRLQVLRDDRDPQFLVTEKRLFLYDNAMRGKELIAFVTYTDDGKTWSKPEQTLETNFIMWKPCTYNGKHYAAVHSKADGNSGKDRIAQLVTSDDGIHWRKISTIRAGNWESETTLFFLPTGKAIGLLRQKYGSPTAQVFEAEAPYTTWQSREPPVNHFSGHCVHHFRGTTYVLTRTMDYGKRQAGTMIYLWNSGKMTPYCKLPAAGDCAYPEAVEMGDDMLVSWYSSHEGPTNVYTARVPLKK